MNALLATIAALSLGAADGPEAIRLSPGELEAIPAAATGAFAALPLLPGTSPLLSPLAVSAVRGKQPATAAFLVDGVELPASFHLLLGPPVLQDGAIGALTFDRGLPPIEHGRTLGGAVSVELAEAASPGLHGASSIDLLRLGTVARWRSASGDTRVSAGASGAWTPWLYTRAASGAPSWDAGRATLQANLGDYFARAEQRVGRGSLRLLAVGSVDQVASASDTDLVGGALAFHRLDLRGRHPLFGGDAEAALDFGWDRLGAELGGPIAQGRALVTQTSFGARAAWGVVLFDAVRLSAGADASRRSADLAQRSAVKPPSVDGEAPGSPVEAGVRAPIADALLTGGFVQAALANDAAWRAAVGFRVDDYHLSPGKDLVTLEPRASAWRALSSDVSLNAGVGLVHQPPSFLVALPGVELAALRAGLQEAVRLNAGLGVRLARHTHVRLDGYFDPLLRAVELSPLDRDFLQAVKAPAGDLADAQRRGWAHGLELMLRRELADGWFGWATATWQRSVRAQRYVTRNDFGEPVGEGVATLPVGFVHDLAATAVWGRTFGRWTVSGAALFHTGAPEVGGLGSTTQREGLDRLRPGPKWIEADLPDAANLPPFYRVDARVAYAFALGPAAMSASLDVQNLTFARELNRYGYAEQADSLADRDAGDVRLTRTAGAVLPGIPFPMLGLGAKY